MGEYSVYRGRGSERKPDAIANAIILKRRYPGNDSLAFLIVEGDTDRRFYQNFIAKDICDIRNTSGKADALRVAAILEQENFSGFLVIVDKVVVKIVRI